MAAGTYIKKERGQIEMNYLQLQKASFVFGVNLDELFDHEIYVVGEVGASGTISFYVDLNTNSFDSLRLLQTAPTPPNVSAHTVALRAAGEVMAGRVDEGDIIYYDELRTPPTEADFDRLCVLGLVDGRVVVRKLHRGAGPGLYNLLLPGAAPMFNTPVLWARRVIAIVPG